MTEGVIIHHSLFIIHHSLNKKRRVESPLLAKSLSRYINAIIFFMCPRRTGITFFVKKVIKKILLSPAGQSLKVLS